MCLVTQGSQGKYSNVTVKASLAPKTVNIDMTLYFLYNYKLGLNPPTSPLWSAVDKTSGKIHELPLVSRVIINKVTQPLYGEVDFIAFKMEG